MGISTSKTSQLLTATLLLPHALSSPYPFPNATTTTPSSNSSEICNTTASLCSANHTAPADLSGVSCTEIYPVDLAIVNARYPTYSTTHLHLATQFFMLRRQSASSDSSIATRVQFSALPASSLNLTCRLEFLLPADATQLIQGMNPSFDVWSVEREVGSVATWDMYVEDMNTVTAGAAETAEGRGLFGTVNGEAEALNRTRHAAGVVSIGQTACNESLSFWMGMRFDGLGGTPNYWAFENVEPPAWPVQGFRVVYGC